MKPKVTHWGTKEQNLSNTDLLKSAIIVNKPDRIINATVYTADNKTESGSVKTTKPLA